MMCLVLVVHGNDVMCKLYGWIWHGNGNNMTEHYIIKYDILYIEC